MVNKIDFPAPLQRKILITAVIGVFCFIVGFTVFLLSKDQTTLLLSLTVLVLCTGQAITLYRIISAKSYEVVEGTCVSIAPKPLRRYRKVAILDKDGNEISLLLNKHDKLRIGYQYRFYFKESDRIAFGKEYFDSVLNSDCYLGYEEVGEFKSA